LVVDPFTALNGSVVCPECALVRQQIGNVKFIRHRGR